MGKFPVAECECGWRVWRADGWTRRQASDAYWEHKRTDCPLSLPWYQ